MRPEHRLERRAALLGAKMRALSEDLALQLGQGGRPPFTEARTRAAALSWWREHRHDAFGARALASMHPLDVVELDAALGRLIAGEQQGEVA